MQLNNTIKPIDREQQYISIGTALPVNEIEVKKVWELIEKARSHISGEITNKYDPKKEMSLLLSESYFRISKFRNWKALAKKAERVFECGTYLEFRGKGLQYANFCKDRLCPMCAWRKSLKIYGEMSAVMSAIDPSNQFLFLTLTVKNVDGHNLSDELDKLYKGYDLFMKKNMIKQGVKGWFRALEVTYNQDTGYHPHFHVVLQVGKDYFGRNYIKQSDYEKMWREAMNLDYDPRVDIRKVDNLTKEKAVAELAKYAVKDNDYIYPKDEKLTDEVVEALYIALKNRRLVAYGGEMKKLHKAVKDKDDKIRTDVTGLITKYHWKVGGYYCSNKL